MSEDCRRRCVRALWEGLAIVMLFMATAQARDFAVISTVDTVDATPGDGTCADASNNCTLRAAIQEANAWAGADTITLPPGVFQLSITGTGDETAATGDLDITEDLIITGAGSGAEAISTIIDGGNHDRVFDIARMAYRLTPPSTDWRSATERRASASGRDPRPSWNCRPQ